MSESKMIEGPIPDPEPLSPEEEAFFEKLVNYQIGQKTEGKLSRFDIDRFIHQGVGRNDPCPCGAKGENGKPKKFKKCCMNNV